VGVLLAVTAAFAIVATNGPDTKADQQIHGNNTNDSANVVEYGQR
jgi:hypothetical protein